MTQPFTIVIPARFGSSRLPGKPLADIGGRPMIAWVYERAAASGAEEVIVATDDRRIAAACEAFGARVELTRADHASGTDRIAELARRLAWDDARIVVNVQGDEPRLPPGLISQAARLLASRPDAAIATLVTPIESPAELDDPNVAKVVADRTGNALYFSRSPIPHGGTAHFSELRRHIGIYAYRVASLKAITAEPPCMLERAERLEQLRALWLGQRIVVADAVERPPRGVDTPQDLAAARAALESDTIDGRARRKDPVESDLE
ncbi:MAG TPA: 3-deoxy-manno-octulosonate cytidylyltransferase [Gammaproteobacteria bacterium]|nr:3-deoxy-manno-octulosonate cytidylyltransferase [Gammaproteobacteria bacterium]